MEISWVTGYRFLLAALLISGPVSAQTFTNGSFETGDFTGWQTSGTPSIATAPPTPASGTYQALINSTGTTASGIYAESNSSTAAQLETFLNTTLPSNAQGAPVNGEAIQQTFSTTAGATVTFSYKYASRETYQNGFDETGYVLNGVFHYLADTNTPGQTTAQAIAFLASDGLPYQTVSITVPAGTTTLGFVTYNTGNTNAPSGLYIDNVTVTPLPSAVYKSIDPPGAVYPQATGIFGKNVVGFYNANGFLYDGTTITPLNPSGNLTEAMGISQTNVVGYYEDANGTDHGFLYDGNSFTTLDPSGSTGTVANAVSGGNVAGYYLDSQSNVHGFLYSSGTFTTLDPPGATYSEIFAISGTHVAGVYGSSDGMEHGFFYDGTSFTTVDPSASTSTVVTGLAGNQVVGWYVDSGGVNHGFFYDGANFTTIDPPGSTNTQVSAIYGADLVGWYTDSSHVVHGFLYDGTNYTTIDPPGSTQTEVNAISGTNLAGWYTDGSNVQHAFVASLDALKTPATVTLDNFSTTYDGTAKSATATTNPGSLNTVVTYNGSLTPPTLPGDYVVVAAVSDSTYQGMTTGALAIAKENAGVSLSNLSFTYDTTAKVPNATTSPPNLNVDLTYNGSPTPPINAGTYSVNAVIDDPIYQGKNSATMTIAQATGTVTLQNLTQTYDGTPKPVSATTTPVSLNVTFTYNGSSTAPSAEGSYTVVGTINDSNYTGSATGTLVISAPSGSTFSSWEQRYGISGAPTNTTQNDGVPLLLKYFYDIDPTQTMLASDQAALPVAGFTTVNNVDYLTITYRQNPLETDLNVVLQQSTDLQTWTTVSSPLSQQVGTDAATGDPIMQMGAPVTGSRQFIRLQVTLP